MIDPDVIFNLSRTVKPDNSCTQQSVILVIVYIQTFVRDGFREVFWKTLVRKVVEVVTRSVV